VVKQSNPSARIQLNNKKKEIKNENYRQSYHLLGQALIE
jgi:hypothetical protein